MTVTFDATRHAYRCGYRYLRSVTGIIRAAGRMGDLAWYGTPAAKRRGSAVHDLTVATEAAGRWDGPGRPMPWPPGFPLPAPEILVPEATGTVLVASPADLAGYLDAYWSWRALYAPVWTHVEATLARLDLDVAGRPDRIGVVLGSSAVVEVKTGAEDDWHGLQTAGYDLLEPLPFERQRYGLYLRSNGKFKFRPHDDVRDRSEFLELCGAAA
jgi:hypothetical protein